MNRCPICDEPGGFHGQAAHAEARRKVSGFGGPTWTRVGVLIRDRNTCVYCGEPAETVDHIIPVSRGGRDAWRNTVAACSTCNHRKNDRTPAEAGMLLRSPPTVPTWEEFKAARRHALDELIRVSEEWGFYEDDEPVADVAAAFDQGRKGVTAMRDRC